MGENTEEKKNLYEFRKKRAEQKTPNEKREGERGTKEIFCPK